MIWSICTTKIKFGFCFESTKNKSPDSDESLHVCIEVFWRFRVTEDKNEDQIRTRNFSSTDNRLDSGMQETTCRSVCSSSEPLSLSCIPRTPRSSLHCLCTKSHRFSWSKKKKVCSKVCSPLLSETPASSFHKAGKLADTRLPLLSWLLVCSTQVFHSRHETINVAIWISTGVRKVPLLRTRAAV